MFETQDMLPRPPPMPSAPASQVASIPTVPEVSIIFEKPTPGQTNDQKTTPPSYAAWKMQNLPRVTFPPNLNDQLNYMSPGSSSSSSTGFITTRSSVYPLRTVTVSTSMANSCTPSISSASSCANEKKLTLATPPSSLSQFSYKSEQRRSMDSLSQRNQAIESTLTICASTQTDAMNPAVETASETFKQEFSLLMDIIKDLREEQHQMRHILETFLLQQQQLIQAQQQHQAQAQETLKVFCCDKATQCETENEGNRVGTPTAPLENLLPFNLENGTLHRALPNAKIYSPTHSTKPAAQSTAYRMNTPLNIRQNGPVALQSNNLYVQNIPALPKASTDRSLVMNELALKYLPSDKLNELMQDAQITAVGNPNKRSVPLRENDNFNKAPTDISNASYKYLRKYRLLPDENRNSPTQNGLQSSPYQQRIQDSPIVGCVNGGSGASAESPHLDLDHIRRQPKFL